MDTPNLTIIIPVYKAEKFIERCARSLFEQRLDKIEYLFIDDCTPDRSVEIIERVLEDYPIRKSWAKVHKMDVNSGQAAVRKWGTEHAKGDYIIHCDSDDWVEHDMYYEMYSAAIAQNADIVICDYLEENGNRSNYIKCVSSTIKTTEDFKFGIITRDVKCNVWNKIVSRKLYQNPITFPVNNYGEDSAIINQVMYYAQKIVYIEKPFYHYWYNPDSITKNKPIAAVINSYKDACANALIVQDFYKGKPHEKKIQWAIEYLKCMERDRLLVITENKEYYRLWKSTFPDLNKRVLFNPVIPLKIKFRFILGYLNLYPLYAKLKGIAPSY